MLSAFTRGLRAAGRNRALALLLWGVSLGLGALLAVPLALQLEAELREREAAVRLRDGFDFAWWDNWHDDQKGFARGFTPELLGHGFAPRNLELLLRGHLPARLFDHGEPGGAKPLDPLILGLGVLYLFTQVFLAGGVLSALRRDAGSFTLRGFVHASGFYFGRLFRLALLTLALYGLVFALFAPVARWADFQGRDAVSETAALGWALGRRALLLLALGAVFVVSSYAKAIVVLEERASALLAVVSAAGFCLRRAGAVAGHALLCVALGLLLLGVWTRLDAAWVTTGWKTQAVAFALMQLFVFGRIALRLAFLGGALALVREDSASA